MNNNSIKPPEKTILSKTEDSLRETLKVLLPGISSIVVDFIFPSTHEKRLDKWRDSIYESLIELSLKKGISIDELRDNDEFMTILKQSLFTASRNHQEEKLQLLKNIILNSIDSNLQTDQKLIFNRLVDELTISHILILKSTFDCYSQIENIKSYEEFYKVITLNNTELEISRDQFLFFITELSNRNLLIISNDVEKFEMVRENSGFTDGDANPNLPNILITNMAKDFITYILN